MQRIGSDFVQLHHSYVFVRASEKKKTTQSHANSIIGPVMSLCYSDKRSSEIKQALPSKGIHGPGFVYGSITFTSLSSVS